MRETGIGETERSGDVTCRNAMQGPPDKGFELGPTAARTVASANGAPTQPTEPLGAPAVLFILRVEAAGCGLAAAGVNFVVPLSQS